MAKVYQRYKRRAKEREMEICKGVKLHRAGREENVLVPCWEFSLETFPPSSLLLPLLFDSSSFLLRFFFASFPFLHSHCKLGNIGNLE